MLSRVTIHCNDLPWQRRYFEYFRRGFTAHGLIVRKSSVDKPDNQAINVIFGPNSWQNTHRQCKRNGVPLLTVNRCFLGDFNDNVAVGWDDFNGLADFRTEGEIDPARYVTLASFEGLPQIVEYEEHDGPLLVLGDYDPGNTAMLLSQIAEALKGGDAVFRPHPGRKNETRLPTAPAALADAIDFCAIAFAYSTTATVETILRGRRAVVLSARNIAYAVAERWDGHRVHFRNLDPMPWLHRLAWSQWHFTEVDSGDFWRHLYTPERIKLPERT
jgi:hypothetical protein